MEAEVGSFASRLAGFCALLRSHGLPVGTGEELDLAQALKHINALDRQAFLLACETTLAKRPEDIELVREAFEAYWSGQARLRMSRSEEGRMQSMDPFQHPAGDLRPPWNPQGRGRGEESTPAERVRLLLYSPDAPSRRGALTEVDRASLRSMRRMARSFRRLEATLEGRRRRPRIRGEPDYLRTTRLSLRYGGEWLRLVRRRKKLQRMRLVVLWDVSGSMEGYAPSLLALAHSLIRAVPSARVFAFSTHLMPLTETLRGRTYPEALRVVSTTLRHARGGTRIGQSLAEFNRTFGRTLDDRTVVVIMSDGWDVGDLDRLEVEMRRVRNRSASVVWINPYADRPGFRPEVAGMRRALPYIDRLVPPSALTKPDLFRRYFRRPSIAEAPRASEGPPNVF